MLQKKDYQQQQTIKKSIVENQTSGKIKTNATKEGLPTTTIKLPTTTKIPTTTTKTNATKQELPTTTIKITNNNKLPTNNKECYKTRTTNNNK